MKITIFTPTYNRAYTLSKLYNSLKSQIFKDFEWLIVDDGSTDSTKELIDGFLIENRIKIRYYKQENAGKHKAINLGVEKAEGVLFMIIDSDDYIVDIDTLKKINIESDFLFQNIDFCGIVGNRCHVDKTIIGNTFEGKYLNSNFLEYREKYSIHGDRAEVILTSVMKEFVFPSWTGEKFCPEGLVLNRIANKYKARYINDSYIVCEYLPDGLSANLLSNRKKSAFAFMTYYAELLKYNNVKIKTKIKAAILFWATYFKSNQSFEVAVSNVGFYVLLFPLGWLLNKVGKL